MVFTILLLTCLFTVLFSGRSLLPFWSLLNTLNLILHTPLFSVAVPAQTAIFMKEMLRLPNLTFLPYTQQIRSWWPPYDLQPSYSEVFEQYGYLSVYVIPNLGFILVLFGGFVALWVLAAIKDLILVQCQVLKRIKSERVRYILMIVTEKDICNFNVRFLM